jgi:hypothetical protein
LYKQHAKELKEKDEAQKSIKRRKRSIGEIKEKRSE